MTETIPQDTMNSAKASFIAKELEARYSYEIDFCPNNSLLEELS